jgi:hypothetical protein
MCGNDGLKHLIFWNGGSSYEGCIVGASFIKLLASETLITWLHVNITDMYFGIRANKLQQVIGRIEYIGVV